ncbi:MAG: Fe-S protein assembly co-chaperone HscB [Candidatus Binatia bacterium]
MTHVESTPCWRCSSLHPVALFCPQCDAIQILPPQTDYFSIFGLSRSPHLDDAALTQRYYELSRRLHPDLYHSGTAEEKAASLQNTALLTRAYRTLRDLVLRAQYWLELQGERLGKENNRVPPALAARVFEVQEKLAELREAQTSEDKEQYRAEVLEMRTDVEGQIDGLRTAIASNLAQWNQENRSPELLQQLKKHLSELAYLRTLLRDIEKESEESWNV